PLVLWDNSLLPLRLTASAIHLAAVHQLKLLRLLAVDFVLKLQVLVGVLGIAPAGVVLLVAKAGGGIAGACEGLGGEVGAAANAIGATEGGVGEFVEAAGRGRGVVGGGRRRSPGRRVGWDVGHFERGHLMLQTE
ncbi:hypothetical protein THAPSDRAFT_bd387, partial [Thalassiosira pseudonana CCMP1335]